VPLQPGDAIGTYRIERVLGAGGMGVVYLAVDTRLGRRAAVKQLLPALSTSHEIVERFFNEAKAAASIDHPSIVEVYDVGWHSDGSAFFAMKLLDGETIGKRMRTSRGLPLELVATIGRQVATALAAAHARGIVHRDLKPDNIMLVRDDEIVIGERAIVLDFGIAKLFADGESTGKTRTGVFMGTPAYMSPEQCRGAADLDHRTDIYALGCIVFEMLTGRSPFIGQGHGEIVGMHQYVPAPAVRSFRADIPEAFDAIVQRALAKSPGDRFATMMELAGALSPFAVHAVRTQPPSANPGGLTQPTGAPPPSSPSTYANSRGEVHAPPRRSRRGLAIGVGAVVAAIVAVAIGVAVTRDGAVATSGDAAVSDDAGSGENPKLADLRKRTERAIAEENWVMAEISAQQWYELSGYDTVAHERLKLAQDEAAAQRALRTLEDAWNAKRYLDGAAAFAQISTTSVYRGRAISQMVRLRDHYVDSKLPEAKRLAAAGECQALSELQVEASRMGGTASAALTLPCTPKPADEPAPSNAPTP
jgi:serine/threonine protein kinase